MRSSLRKHGRIARSRPPKSNPLVLRDHAIDDSVLLCLLRAHEVVPLGVLLDFLYGLARVMGDDLVKAPTDVDDLFGMDLDIRGLALEARQHLMDQDLRVR